MFVCLSVCLFAGLFVCLFVGLFVCVLVCLFACLGGPGGQELLAGPWGPLGAPRGP